MTLHFYFCLNMCAIFLVNCYEILYTLNSAASSHVWQLIIYKTWAWKTCCLDLTKDHGSIGLVRYDVSNPNKIEARLPKFKTLCAELSKNRYKKVDENRGIISPFINNRIHYSCIHFCSMNLRTVLTRNYIFQPPWKEKQNSRPAVSKKDPLNMCVV